MVEMSKRQSRDEPSVTDNEPKVTPEHCLMATLMHPDMAMMMTKMEIYMDNSPVTEDSQYLSQGEMIGMKNDIAWIIKFFITTFQIKTLYYLQLVQ